MNKLKSALHQSIPKTKLKVWHVVALEALVWIGPVFFFQAMSPALVYLFIILWIVSYKVMEYLMKKVLRATTFDIILVERFFVLMSFLLPVVIGLVDGILHGFGGIAAFFLIFSSVGALAVALSIVLHIKNASKYYHGVTKESLFL